MTPKTGVQTDESGCCLAAFTFEKRPWQEWLRTRRVRTVRIHDERDGVTVSRPLFRVDIEDRKLLADHVTGTLYDARTGLCLGADYRRAILPRRK